MKFRDPSSLMWRAAICVLLTTLTDSWATDPVIELWQRQHALLEKRHAFTMEQLEKIDQRVQRDAEGFLSKVETAPDDNAVISWASLYPRLFSNEQAYEAYKKALARMEVEGRSNVAGLSDESRFALTQILTDAIKRAGEEDDADRAKLFAELDEIKKDSDAFAEERETYVHRNQVLGNQREIIQQQRDILEMQEGHSSGTVNHYNASGRRADEFSSQPRQMSGSSDVKLNAYGAGINADQFGRPHTYRTQDGQDVGVFSDGVKRDAYGAGVHADQFGRPVYDSAP